MSGILVFSVTLGVTCGFALWRGGGPERVASVILLAAALASRLLYSDYSSVFATAETGVLIVDHIALIFLIILMVRADRLWPIAMVAFQLLTVLGHWVLLIEPPLARSVHGLILQGLAYPMQLLLAVAAYLHHQRVKKTGADNSWLRFSRPSRPIRPPSRTDY